MSNFTLSSIVLEGERNCNEAKLLFNYVQQVRLNQIEKVEVRTFLTFSDGSKTIGQFRIYKFEDNGNKKHPVHFSLTYNSDSCPVCLSSEIDDDSFEFTDNICKIKTTDSQGSAIIPWFTDYYRLTRKDGFYYMETEDNGECHTNDYENKYFGPEYELDWVEPETWVIYDKEIDGKKEEEARRESAAL